jgi:flagellar M-ring protein FliF
VLDDDPNNPNPALRQSVTDAMTAAAGIDPNRGDILTVTSLAFNRDELLATQTAMADATQKEQLMSYLHLAALVIGPVLMLVALFFILGRRRKRTALATATLALNAAQPKLIEVTELAPPTAARAAKLAAANGQVIGTEDPQKLYVREQIQMLGKSNPATVAQLIQTWMDEDRRN